MKKGIDETLADLFARLEHVFLAQAKAQLSLHIACLRICLCVRLPNVIGHIRELFRVVSLRDDQEQNVSVVCVYAYDVHVVEGDAQHTAATHCC